MANGIRLAVPVRHMLLLQPVSLAGRALADPPLLAVFEAVLLVIAVAAGEVGAGEAGGGVSASGRSGGSGGILGGTTPGTVPIGMAPAGPIRTPTMDTTGAMIRRLTGRIHRNRIHRNRKEPAAAPASI